MFNFILDGITIPIVKYRFLFSDRHIIIRFAGVAV